MHDWLFLSGNLSLDFCNSLRDRRKPAPRETIQSPSDLVGWFEAADFASAVDLTSRVTPDELDGARQLRAALYLLATSQSAQSDGTPLNTATPAELDTAVRTVNRFAAVAPQAALASEGPCLYAEQPDAQSPEELLGVVALSFIGLVAEGMLTLVKECTASDCGLLFIDDSRGSRRRWCSMQRCGNRAKAKRFTARHTAEAEQH